MQRKGLISLGLALVATPLLAQTPPVAPPPAPPSSAARDPLALPGDNLPPSLAQAVALPPPPPPPGAPRPAPMPRPVIAAPSMDVALAAAQAALSACAKDNLTVGVAVSDSAGGLVVGLQMTGANPGRIYNAARKNLTAIEFGVPTSVTRQKLRDKDYETLARVRPNMTLFSGAVPLLSNGQVIGAIGVSGATSAQDEACAAAGAAAVAGRL